VFCCLIRASSNHEAYPRRTDFLSGLPTEPIQDDVDVPLPPADRIRFVHDFITSIDEDGGLGITPGFGQWDLVESIMCIHDQKFNEQWIHSWTRSRTSKVSLEKIREQVSSSTASVLTKDHALTPVSVRVICGAVFCLPPVLRLCVGFSRCAGCSFLLLWIALLSCILCSFVTMVNRVCGVVACLREITLSPIWNERVLPR
jgi:hypothetical protein